MIGAKMSAYHFSIISYHALSFLMGRIALVYTMGMENNPIVVDEVYGEPLLQGTHPSMCSKILQSRNSEGLMVEVTGFEPSTFGSRK